MGSGVPQYRSREIAQSTPPLNQSPNLPCLMCWGCQEILSLLEMILVKLKLKKIEYFETYERR